MKIQQYAALELEAINRGMNKALNGLNERELSWRPACGCNSIGLILFHVARFEDAFVQGRLQGKPEIWTAERWYEKLNKAEDDTGSHYTADQVNAFGVPPLKDIQAYFEAARVNTLNYVKDLDAGSFDKKIQTPRFGEVTIAFMISLIIGHEQQHIGEISYLRGLQRGIDK